MSKKIYEVLEVKGKPGLTVGSRVVPAGERFTSDMWSWGAEALENAVEQKRCKVVSSIEEKKDKKDKKADD